MTRAQDTSIYNTSTADNATNEATAQKAATDEQTGISDYANSVAKLAANNPYGTGGEYATDQNQVLSDASNAGTGALAAQLQAVAQRTGQNPAASVAATEAGAEDNTRTLGDQMATADQNRIASEAGYNEGVTSDTAKIPELQNSLYSTAGGQADANESAANTASANNKSFGDQFGGAFATGLGSGLAKIATLGAGGGGSTGGGGGSASGPGYDGLDDAQGISQAAGGVDPEDVEGGLGEIAFA